MQSPDNLLNLLDYLVIAAYLAGTMILGLLIGGASAVVPISSSQAGSSPGGPSACRSSPQTSVVQTSSVPVVQPTDMGSLSPISNGSAAYLQ